MLAAELGGAGEQFVFDGDGRAPAEFGVECAQQCVLAAGGRREVGCAVYDAVLRALGYDEHAATVSQRCDTNRAPTRTNGRRSASGSHHFVDLGDASAGRIADQLHSVAVPAEPDHAVQPGNSVGVPQRDGISGAHGVVNAVEAVGIRHTGGDELAEMEHHGAGVRVLRVGVGLHDHHGQWRTLVVIACQRLGAPSLIASRVTRQLRHRLGDLGCRQVDVARLGLGGRRRDPT